ncbi:MAG: TIGR00730 family Rossman fold protein [Nocardioidaceae bacterium]
MSRLQTVCVFAGASAGRRPAYVAAAAALGAEVAARGLRLVYGGGSLGLMGTLAEAALAAGGEVVGVIPRTLVERELAHRGLSELVVTATMHDRKARMADLADGFVALPGGLGTLEELAEVLTWSQLGIQRKPAGLLDVESFFDPLLAFLDHTVTQGFLAEEHRRLLLAADRPGVLLDRLADWEEPTGRWVEGETGSSRLR